MRMRTKHVEFNVNLLLSKINVSKTATKNHRINTHSGVIRVLKLNSNKGKAKLAEIISHIKEAVVEIIF